MGNWPIMFICRMGNWPIMSICCPVEWEIDPFVYMLSLCFCLYILYVVMSCWMGNWPIMCLCCHMFIRYHVMLSGKLAHYVYMLSCRMGSWPIILTCIYGWVAHCVWMLYWDCALVNCTSCTQCSILPKLGLCMYYAVVGGRPGGRPHLLNGKLAHHVYLLSCWMGNWSIMCICCQYVFVYTFCTLSCLVEWEIGPLCVYVVICLFVIMSCWMGNWPIMFICCHVEWVVGPLFWHAYMGEWPIVYGCCIGIVHLWTVLVVPSVQFCPSWGFACTMLLLGDDPAAVPTCRIGEKWPISHCDLICR